MRRLLGAAGFFLLAWAAPLTLVPTSPKTRVAKPGEIVTHVFRLEGEGGPYTPIFSSSAGFPILSRPRPVRPPAYLPVTERIPEDALEGTLDVLTVRVDGAEASVQTRVAYSPALSVKVPSRLDFRPPRVPLRVEVQNRGNGVDRVELTLRRGDTVVDRAELALKPFANAVRVLYATEPGSYRLLARLRRGKRSVERRVVVQAPDLEAPGSPDLLTGQLSAEHGLPGGQPASRFSLAGKLSDYVRLRGLAGYAGTGYGYLDLIGPAWRVGAGWSRHPWGYLALWEGPVEARFSYHDPQRSEALLRVSATGSQHTLAFGLRPAFYLWLFGFSSWSGLRFQYATDVAPSDGRWASTFGVSFRGWRMGYALSGEPEVIAQRLTLKGAYRSLRGDASVALERGEVSANAALIYQPDQAQFYRVAASTEALALGGWFRLSTAPDWSLGLGGGYAWTGVLRAYLHSDLAWPEDHMRVRGELGWESTQGLQAALRLDREMDEVLEGELDFRGALRIPWKQSELGLTWTWRRGLRHFQGALTWFPLDQRARVGFNAQYPLGPTVLTLSGGASWPGPDYHLRLGAAYAFTLEVPSAVSDWFGGKRLGVITGRVRLPPGARVDLTGLRVEAGGRSAYTDAEGRFSLTLPPGRYLIRLDPATLPVLLFVKRSVVEVELKEKARVYVEFPATLRGSLEGQVEVQADWTPPPVRFAIEVRAPTGRALRFFTDRQGRFSLPGIAPGLYEVRLLRDFLPPGWAVEVGEVRVSVAPGRVQRVRLVVRAPAKQLAKALSVSVLSVRPEVERVPPGARPLVEAEIRGKPQRVVVRWKERVLGELRPVANDRWRGRVTVPEEARGVLRYVLAAEALGGRVEYVFFLNADPKAPWGVVRTRPIVHPGWRGVPLAVHLYTPAKEVWLKVGEKSYMLKGQGADWQGRYDVPPSARGRLLLLIQARRGDGRVIELRRGVLVR